MSSSTAFRSHQRSQLLFLPPDMMSWLSEGGLGGRPAPPRSSRAFCLASYSASWAEYEANQVPFLCNVLDTSEAEALESLAFFDLAEHGLDDFFAF